MQNYKLAGAILADSFFHYPLMQYAFAGQPDEQRHKSLRQLYVRCSSAAALYGGIVNPAGGEAALIWLPSKHFPLGLCREMTSGMIGIPFVLGLKATLRLIRHDEESEGWIKQNAGEKMGYIWCLGVAASARGKGLSRQLVDQSITDMRAQGLNEFWLKTEDPKNVTIYQKMGFEVMNEMTVKSSGIKSWAMRRV